MNPLLFRAKALALKAPTWPASLNPVGLGSASLAAMTLQAALSYTPLDPAFKLTPAPRPLATLSVHTPYATPASAKLAPGNAVENIFSRPQGTLHEAHQASPALFSEGTLSQQDLLKTTSSPFQGKTVLSSTPAMPAASYDRHTAPTEGLAQTLSVAPALQSAFTPAVASSVHAKPLTAQKTLARATQAPQSALRFSASGQALPWYAQPAIETNPIVRFALQMTLPAASSDPISLALAQLILRSDYLPSVSVFWHSEENALLRYAFFLDFINTVDWQAAGISNAKCGNICAADALETTRYDQWDLRHRRQAMANLQARGIVFQEDLIHEWRHMDQAALEKSMEALEKAGLLAFQVSGDESEDLRSTPHRAGSGRAYLDELWME